MFSRRSILQYLGIGAASVACPAIAVGSPPVIQVPLEAILPCDGRALSRVLYSALYGVIGKTYTFSHDGSEMFNLPDLRPLYGPSPNWHARAMMVTGVGDQVDGSLRMPAGSILYVSPPRPIAVSEDFPDHRGRVKIGRMEPSAAGLIV